MAISAAFGIGSLRVSNTNHGSNSLLRRQNASVVTAVAGNVSDTVSNDNLSEQSSASSASSTTSPNQSLSPSMVQYNTDNTNAQSFANPVVTRILQSDTAIPWGCEATTSPFAPKSQFSKAAKVHTAAPSIKTGSAANIGGIRRALKRAHTPEGLILHYETRLRSFLGVADSTDDGDDDSGSENGDDWTVIEQEDGMFSPLGYKSFMVDDMVVLEKALDQIRNVCRNGSSSKQYSSPEIVAGIKNSLVAQWNVKDSFTRMIVHTMCRYYGLVSFSDTTDSGNTALHICHPRFFNDQDAVSLPSSTFHQFIFNK